MYDKVYKLFEFGQEIASKAGFILLDTKYEFGKDENNNIILIDELHTCDSSRYWIKSYQRRFDAGLEPEKLDKDCVRDYENQCDPYNDKIPSIPDSIIQKAYSNYEYFYNTILTV